MGDGDGDGDADDDDDDYDGDDGDGAADGSELVVTLWSQMTATFLFQGYQINVVS